VHTLTNTLQLQQANTRWLSTVALLCHQALDESPLRPPHCAEQTSRLAEAFVVGSPAGCHAVRRASVCSGLMVAAPCSDPLGGEHPPNPAADTFAAVARNQTQELRCFRKNQMAGRPPESRGFGPPATPARPWLLARVPTEGGGFLCPAMGRAAPLRTAVAADGTHRGTVPSDWATGDRPDPPSGAGTLAPRSRAWGTHRVREQPMQQRLSTGLAWMAIFIAAAPAQRIDVPDRGCWRTAWISYARPFIALSNLMLSRFLTIVAAAFLVAVSVMAKT
jgi:hypothetical protein